MTLTGSLDHDSAYRYAAAWAEFDHDDIHRLATEGSDFHGTLGSLEFEYKGGERTLHVWSIVAMAMGPLLGERAEVKTTLDGIARQHPEETAGGVFDVRSLEWHRQPAGMDPCLFLRLDVHDSSLPADQMDAKLKELARTAYVWHRQKLNQVLENYWKEHPRPAR
ncbi:hypothetical protein [Granulicella arctica]|uniref:hypothetical protein n=1 Tax=Granulicella arctica TaxID=940613 RepID=UPI0021DF790F|nr:hypothetical protein [Granulicella arctica]